MAETEIRPFAHQGFLDRSGDPAAHGVYCVWCWEMLVEATVRRSIDPRHTWPNPQLHHHFGPQHPAAHGVLRSCSSSTEWSNASIPTSACYRGTELIERRPTAGHRLFDRLDYVAPMNQEHAFCLAVEKLLESEVPKRAQLIATLYSEIGRLLSPSASTSPPRPWTWRAHPSSALWGLRSARSSGVLRGAPQSGRMNARSTSAPAKACIRICRCNSSRTSPSFAKRIPKVLDDIEGLQADRTTAFQRSATPTSASFSPRGLLHEWSSRRAGPRAVPVQPGPATRPGPTSAISERSFDIPIGKNGDNCYDRYCIRMEEMRQQGEDHGAVLRRNCSAEERPGPARRPTTREVVPPKRAENEASMGKA